MRIARDEIFGPVVCIIEAGSLEEAVAINNDVPYGLVSSIYTQNINRIRRDARADDRHRLC